MSPAGRHGELLLRRRGKVRDIYDAGDGTLLLVATDRVSAFNVPLPTPIPGKGIVLTTMSRWWFHRTREIIPNHVVEMALPAAAEGPEFAGRTMRVAAADRIDVECVVRGYLSGTGWAEYNARQTLAGEPLAAGFVESSQLPEPRFTPAVKNDTGDDENISRQVLANIVGNELATRLEERSIELFTAASRHCEGRGIILADTKFEFGYVNGHLTLIDEVLTPDSSRFWDASTWRPGPGVPSFDKQFIRDHLRTVRWDRTPPGPALPPNVVEGTRARYHEALRRICDLDIGPANLEWSG